MSTTSAAEAKEGGAVAAADNKSPLAAQQPATDSGVDKEQRAKMTSSKAPADDGQTGAKKDQASTPPKKTKEKQADAAQQAKPSNDNKEAPPKVNSKHVIKTPRGIKKWPNQVVESLLKRGFQFNVMIVGESGCGKTTFAHSLFDIRSELKSEEHPSKNFDIYSFKTNDPQAPVTVRVVETKNYNATLDPDRDLKNILDYIEETNRGHLQSETKFKLSEQEEDRRIHALFFMMTSTKALNESQMKVLRGLSHINVIPLLSKSDTMTDKERSTFKEQFKAEIKSAKIDLFKFPENMIYREENKKFNQQIPFCVLGSMEFAETPRGQVRARSYSYGVIEIENKQHSEFSELRDAIINYNLVNLVKVTDQHSYGQYRTEAFRAIKFNPEGKESSIDLIAKHVKSLKNENERETQTMKQTYEEISCVEERKFKQREAAINEQFESQAKELREKIAALQQSINATGSIKKKK